MCLRIDEIESTYERTNHEGTKMLFGQSVGILSLSTVNIWGWIILCWGRGLFGALKDIC